MFWFDNYVYYHCACVTTALLRRWNVLLLLLKLAGWLAMHAERIFSSSAVPSMDFSLGRRTCMVNKIVDLFTSSTFVYPFVIAPQALIYLWLSALFAYSRLNGDWVVLIVLLHQFARFPWEYAGSWLGWSCFRYLSYFWGKIMFPNNGFRMQPIWINQLLLINNLWFFILFFLSMNT